MPMRSIVLASGGSSETMAFNKIGRLTPMSRPAKLCVPLVYNYVDWFNYSLNNFLFFCVFSSNFHGCI